MAFTLRNLKEDLEDVGSNFDGAPDLEFRLATGALGLEKSGLRERIQVELVDRHELRSGVVALRYRSTRVPA